MKLIKIEKTVLNTCIWMALEFFEDCCPSHFLTFVQNSFGSKNTFLAIFQKYRFSQN